AAFLDQLGEPFVGLDAAIHPGDAMARFAERSSHGVRDVAWLEYFRSGHAGFRAVDQLLRWRFGGPEDGGGPSRLLDFGCGHGRVTRFLARTYGTERVVATEVDPGAVDFVRRFGVEARVSTRDPAAFEAPEGIDALVALSVLSHLPEAAFRGWLARWWQMLAPGGLLVFSVLDERVLLPGRVMPDDGFHFERMSESEVLDLDDYGTTWVSEAFVRDVLGDCFDAAVVERLPLGRWHLQDLWVLVKGPAPALPSLSAEPHPFDPGPVGYLEACEVSADRRRVEVRGWARSASGKTRVTLDLGGVEVATATPDGLRDDLPPTALARGPAGFRLVADLPESIAPATRLCLTVRDGRTDAVRVLHLATVEATELYARLAEARADAARLADDVAVFEASGFGRLRRRWMAWKRQLGR
ncbi:MAG: class I SAM-dependent methyltransferase, partial [Acidobacteriota bacterium]